MGRRALVIVALALSVAVAAGVDAAGPPSRAPGGPPGGGGDGDAAFELSGSVSGLYPGVVVQLPVKLENPFNFAILVQEIRVIVGDASPQCVAANVEVGPRPNSILVDADGEVAVSVPLTLSTDAANECQDATFPLTYEAQAVRP